MGFCDVSIVSDLKSLSALGRNDVGSGFHVVPELFDLLSGLDFVTPVDTGSRLFRY